MNSVDIKPYYISDDIEDMTIDEIMLFDRKELPFLGGCEDSFLKDYLSNRNYFIMTYKCYLLIRSVFPNYSWKNMYTEDEVNSISRYSLRFQPSNWQDLIDRVSLTQNDMIFLKYYGMIDLQTFDLLMLVCETVHVPVALND